MNHPGTVFFFSSLYKHLHVCVTFLLISQTFQNVLLETRYHNPITFHSAVSISVLKYSGGNKNAGATRTKSSVLIIYCSISTQANSGQRQQMVSMKVQSKNVKVVYPATNFMFLTSIHLNGFRL